MKAMELLATHVSYASQGKFPPEHEAVDPMEFATAMTSTHEGEGFRAEFLRQKVEELLPGDRVLQHYVRDRQAGMLVPHDLPAADDNASAAASADAHAANPHKEARLAVLAAEMDRKRQRIRALQTNLPTPKAVPAGDRVTSAEVDRIKIQYEEAQQALEVVLSKRTIKEDPWGVLVADAKAEHFGLPGLPAEPPTVRRVLLRDVHNRVYVFPTASSEPSNASRPPRGLAVGPPLAAPSPFVTAAGASGGATSAGNAGGVSYSQATGLVEREVEPFSLTRTAWEELKGASRRYEEAREARRLVQHRLAEWADYDAHLHEVREREKQLQELIEEEGKLYEQFTKLAQPAVSGPFAAVAHTQPFTIEGYFSVALGRPITPNLCIYHIVRAAFYAVYVLAGNLDQHGYTQLKQREDQSLQSWGGQIQAMSVLFPNLTPAAHASIYVEGIRDQQLRRKLNEHRQKDKACNDLETLITLAMNLTNNEVSILQERLRLCFTQTPQRREDEQRMHQLHQLLGSKSPYGPSSALRAKDGGADKAKAGEQQPREPLTRFRDHQHLRTYMQQQCRMHPASRHTNGDCKAQRELLATKAATAFGAGAVGFAANAVLPGGPSFYSSPYTSSSSQPTGPSWSYQPQGQPEWGLSYGHAGPVGGYSGYDSGYNGYNSGHGGYEAGFAAQTLKTQRQQGLLNARPGAVGAGGAAGPGPGPGLGGRGQPPGGPRPPSQWRGQMELPPPPTGDGPCQYCGHSRNHFPYVCAIQFPWLANPLSFKPPTDTTTERYKRFTDRRRLMAPHQKLGHFLPDWFRAHKHLLSPRHQQMIEGHLAEISRQQGQQGMLARTEFGACCIVDQRSIYQYYEERENRGEYDQAFINVVPPEFQRRNESSSSSASSPGTTRQLAYQVMHIEDTDEDDSDDPESDEEAEAAAATDTSLPAASEIAAAFPQSFLQQDDPPAGPANQPKLRERKRGKGLTLDQAKMAGILHALQGVVASIQDLMPAADNEEAEEQAAGLAGRVSFVDELDIKQRQQQGLAQRGRQLAKELAALRREYNIGPSKSDSKGIHALLRSNRGRRHYTLDRMVNATPATGFSLVLANGRVVLLTKSCWDTGASMSLIDRDTCRRNGIQYRPTKIRLTLANGQQGKVVGITEPIWGVFAAGTPQEAKVLVLALVIDGVGPVFEFIGGKDIQHAADVSVRPKLQVIEYNTDAGERHSLPINGYEVDEGSHALMADLVKQTSSTAMTDEMEGFTAHALVGLVEDACLHDEPSVATTATDAPADATLAPALVDPIHRCKGATCVTGAGAMSAFSAALLRVELAVLTLGGCEQVAVRIWCPADSPSATDSVPHPAKILAMGAGCDKATLPASQVPPDSTVAKTTGRFTVGDVLKDAGYVPQHWSYRAVAYICSFLVGLAVFMGSCVLSLAASVTAFHYADFKAWVTHVLMPWYRALLSQLVSWAAGPGDFHDPACQYLHRSRKKGRVAWHVRFLHYYCRRRVPSASVMRQCRRYTLAFRLWRWQSRTAACIRAALHTSRFSFSTARVFLLLLLVTYVSAAAASPDGLQLLQVATGNLAALELSRLAGCRFR